MSFVILGFFTLGFVAESCLSFGLLVLFSVLQSEIKPRILRWKTYPVDIEFTGISKFGSPRKKTPIFRSYELQLLMTSICCICEGLQGPYVRYDLER